MSAVQVTGCSSAGKSAVAGVLGRRGLAAVDADDDPLLARSIDAVGNVVEEPEEPVDGGDRCCGGDTKRYATPEFALFNCSSKMALRALTSTGMAMGPVLPPSREVSARVGRSGKPVTSQVTTALVDAGPGQSQPDGLMALTCPDATQRDPLRPFLLPGRPGLEPCRRGASGCSRRGRGPRPETRPGCRTRRPAGWCS